MTRENQPAQQQYYGTDAARERLDARLGGKEFTPRAAELDQRIAADNRAEVQATIERRARIDARLSGAAEQAITLEGK